jgi:hypothetical protein
MGSFILKYKEFCINWEKFINFCYLVKKIIQFLKKKKNIFDHPTDFLRFQEI